jgi:predicted AAA+ superfamily ATPase
VRAEQLVRDLDPFRDFLEVAAQRNGKIINFSRMAIDVGVSDKTIHSYLQILQDTYIGFYLPSFHRSIRKSQKQHPKFYYFDIGVKRQLDRTIDSWLVPGTVAYGEAFEHFIILEIFRLAAYYQKDWT